MMENNNDLSKDGKILGFLVVFSIVFIIALITAVVGTGLYLAVHNWG